MIFCFPDVSVLQGEEKGIYLFSGGRIFILFRIFTVAFQKLRRSDPAGGDIQSGITEDGPVAVDDGAEGIGPLVFLNQNVAGPEIAVGKAGVGNDVQCRLVTSEEVENTASESGIKDLVFFCFVEYI